MKYNYKKERMKVNRNYIKYHRTKEKIENLSGENISSRHIDKYKLKKINKLYSDEKGKLNTYHNEYIDSLKKKTKMDKHLKFSKGIILLTKLREKKSHIFTRSECISAFDSKVTMERATSIIETIHENGNKTVSRNIQTNEATSYKEDGAQNRFKQELRTHDDKNYKHNDIISGYTIRT